MRVEAGEDVAAAVAAGGHVVLGPGVHRGGLFIEASVLIEAEPGAVLDAGGRGAGIFVPADDLEVVVRGLHITGGRAELGAGVKLTGWSRLTLEGCVIEGNRPAQGGAGGIGQSAGELLVRGGRLAAGNGALLTGAGAAEFDGVEVDGEVAVREGARLTLRGGRVGELHLRGTTTRRPKVVSQGCAVSTLHNDEAHPGEVSGL